MSTDTQAATQSNILDINIWLRFLFMVLFWLVLTPIGWVLGAVVLVQFVIVLFSGDRNERLQNFGANLGTYLKQIVDFLCFRIEDKPFPFADFPSVDAK